jgi:MuDR family transposase
MTLANLDITEMALATFYYKNDLEVLRLLLTDYTLGWAV